MCRAFPVCCRTVCRCVTTNCSFVTIFITLNPVTVTERKPVIRVRLQRAEAKQCHSRQIPINLAPNHVKVDEYETSECLHALSRHTKSCSVKSITTFTCSQNSVR
jgi:nicotinamide mononucleotide adenylyltransferase